MFGELFAFTSTTYPYTVGSNDTTGNYGGSEDLVGDDVDDDDGPAIMHTTEEYPINPVEETLLK